MSYENSAVKWLTQIARISSMDRELEIPRWVHLARDVYTYNLMRRWLSACVSTQWDTLDAQQRMQNRMKRVEEFLQNHDELATKFLTATAVPLASTPPAISVTDGDGIDPRIRRTLESMKDFSENAEILGKDLTDLPLSISAAAYATARQAVWLRHVAWIKWEGSKSGVAFSEISNLLFKQYSRRQTLGEEYAKATIKPRLQKLIAACEYRPLSDFGEIHGPETDIFGAVSSAYDRLEDNGDLGDPEDAVESPIDDQGQMGVPEIDDSEEISPEERDEAEKWLEHGGLPPPDYYKDAPDENLDPLPEKH